MNLELMSLTDQFTLLLADSVSNESMRLELQILMNKIIQVARELGTQEGRKMKEDLVNK